MFNISCRFCVVFGFCMLSINLPHLKAKTNYEACLKSVIILETFRP